MVRLPPLAVDNGPEVLLHPVTQISQRRPAERDIH